MDLSLFNALKRKKILILGFGKEGQSTYKFLNKYVDYSELAIADKNPEIKNPDLVQSRETPTLLLGEDYLKDINHYDIVFKSPGISYSILDNRIKRNKITSQTEFFLKIFRNQIVGITGTKGKSTTSSLVYSILSNANKNALLVGNIGIPPLNYMDQISPDYIVVYEMSSHQLDGIEISPNIAVFLNLFEEHLDHYNGMNQYKTAKYNIFKHQKKGDWVIINREQSDLVRDVRRLCPESGIIMFPAQKNDSYGAWSSEDNKIIYRFGSQSREYDFTYRTGLPGFHNLKNIMAAVCVSELLGIDHSIIQKAVTRFRGLEHRLEYVGKFKGVHFFNDSIATIPEATIEAVNTLKRVDLLILGGKDRGINYDALIDFLAIAPVRKIVLTGQSGNRLKSLLQSRVPKDTLISIRSFSELPNLIRKFVPENGNCLLSPAAASYDMFRNFEERGNLFKEIVKNL